MMLAFVTRSSFRLCFVVVPGAVCNGLAIATAEGSETLNCLAVPGSRSIDILLLGDNCLMQTFDDTVCGKALVFKDGPIHNTCLETGIFDSFEITCG